MKTAVAAFLMFVVSLASAAVIEPQSAEEMWQQIIVKSRTPPPMDRTPESEVARLTELEELADAFWQRYADNPNVWEAKVIVLHSRVQRDQIQGKKPDLRVVAADVKEVAGAEAAPMPLRAEAAYLLLELTAASLLESGKADELPAFDALAGELVRQFPISRQAGLVPWLRMDVYEKVAPAKLEAVLKEYAEDRNPRVAMTAKSRLAVRDLQKKPLDLKFTTVDGKPFDLSKWRGKVVLVDFWATWCGPCRVDTPRIVEAYRKLNEKGFEIVGISLDSDKDKLLAYTKETGMSWPQYFDGKSWQNEVSSAYGIAGIPTMWLVDKKGFVRITEARADLEANVVKLLAE